MKVKGRSSKLTHQLLANLRSDAPILAWQAKLNPHKVLIDSKAFDPQSVEGSCSRHPPTTLNLHTKHGYCSVIVAMVSFGTNPVQRGRFRWPRRLADLALRQALAAALSSNGHQMAGCDGTDRDHRLTPTIRRRN
jgi:hypothetical protein